MAEQGLSIRILRRLPRYLDYLNTLPGETEHISATQIAEAVGMNDVQVRKDLAAASTGGRPKTGYPTQQLKSDIEALLTGGRKIQFCIVGMGHLGLALAQYQGFAQYGLSLAAAFDPRADKVGQKAGSVYIDHTEQMARICKERNIKVGIISVQAEQAQWACDALISAGVEAIWNFAPTHLQVAPDVFIEHENMAASLNLISRHLSSRETINSEEESGKAQ